MAASSSSTLEEAMQRIAERLPSVGAAGLLGAAESYTFSFKGRETVGGALHVAALCSNSELVGALLDARADPHEYCSAVAFGGLSDMTPLHLASGVGCVESIKELLWARASIEILSKHMSQKEGKKTEKIPHYRPLHEACFCGQPQAVRMLLEMGANMNAQNMKGQTPLHVAAQVGSWRSAALLVEARADLASEDGKGQTPLMVAVRKSFPLRKISILARPCVRDLKIAAIEDPPAALELLRDRKSWKAALTENYSKQPTVEDLVVLLRAAPYAAAELLDVLTVEPKATNPGHHPLPKYGYRPRFDNKPVEYQPDLVWVYYPDKVGRDCFPDWHERLVVPVKRHTAATEEKVPRVTAVQTFAQTAYESMAPPPPGSNRLQVNVLLIPNVVSVEVFRALSEMKRKHEYRRVFGSESVQAIVDYAWDRVTMRPHTAQFFFKFVELAVLMYFARFAPRNQEEAMKEDEDTRFWMRCSWAVLAVSSMRETFKNILLYFAHTTSIRRLVSLTYFFSGRNSFALVSVAVFGWFTWFNGDPEIFAPPGQLLATVALFRWLNLIFMLRSFRFLDLGFKIVPLVNSFFHVGGIWIVLAVTYCAFTHSYLALDTSAVDSSNPVGGTMLNAFRLLLMADGDGIDYVLRLGGEEDDVFLQIVLYISVLIFCIGILNLFIAVHGEAYANACAEVTEAFYLQRAEVCLEALMMPKWTRRLPLGPWKCYLAAVLPAAGAFAALLRFSDLHAAIPSAIMFAGLSFGEFLLRKRPWQELRSEPLRSERESLESLVPPLQPTIPRAETKESQDTAAMMWHHSMRQTPTILRNQGSCYIWWSSWDTIATDEAGQEDAVAELERTCTDRFDRVMSRLDCINRRLSGIGAGTEDYFSATRRSRSTTITSRRWPEPAPDSPQAQASPQQRPRLPPGRALTPGIVAELNAEPPLPCAAPGAPMAPASPAPALAPVPVPMQDMEILS